MTLAERLAPYEVTTIHLHVYPGVEVIAVPFEELTCSVPGCEGGPDLGAIDPTRCEYHQLTWGGVYAGECYCSGPGPADNMDIDICGPHRMAYTDIIQVVDD